ncbi:MAG: sigma-70 family RNA polymerase sigma factor [Anaerolineae bacterium]|nr:sigma-70 family RNA polymerase sigma factor [Anaerolineae bacterium]
MDTLGLLFSDIAQIPILTNFSQELWLGIQIKAPQTWEALGVANDATLPVIYADLRKRFSKLKAICARKADIVTPKLEIWIAEALEAYRNIYGLQRSSLHQFVKSTSMFPENIGSELTNEAYDIAESLCLLPEPMLEYLVDIPEGRKRLPPIPQFTDRIRYYQLGEIWQAVEERADQAHATLVNGYLRYVLRIARNHIGQGVDYLDLVQDGVLGLMRAAERFDYRQGARFAVFASSWIWQGISRAIADHGRTIRLPVHMHERVCSLQKQLEKETIEDVLASCAINDAADIEEDEEDGAPSSTAQKPSASAKARRKTYRMIEYCQPLIPIDLELPISLCEQVGITDEVGVSLADCVTDYETEGAIGTSYEQSEWQQNVQIVFDAASRISARDPDVLRLRINTRDVEVMRLRYGLDDGQERTLEEVGQQFDLTRERIRQIEKRTLPKLKQILRAKGFAVDFAAQSACFGPLPSPIGAYLDEHFSFEQGNKDTEMTLYQQIDYYLSQLPGGDWHTYRVPGGSTRQDQVLAAMRVLETPAHYNAIAEQVNDLAGESQMDESYVYAVLMKYEDVFVRLGEGFFSLAEWECQRTTEAEPVLPFCPTPFPDPPDQPNAFFESVMIVREILQKPCGIMTFLRTLTEWSRLPWPQPRWVCQGALSAYYLVGAIPYVFYTEGTEQVLSLSLPTTDLSTLRGYCLDTLSRRLQAMPEFWWFLQRHQPLRVTELVQLFVVTHPLELDDVTNRLNLLAGIGAAQKSSYGGRYQLTPLGDTLATRWARQPENIDVAVDESLTEDEWDFVEFSFE